MQLEHILATNNYDLNRVHKSMACFFLRIPDHPGLNLRSPISYGAEGTNKARKQLPESQFSLHRDMTSVPSLPAVHKMTSELFRD